MRCFSGVSISGVVRGISPSVVLLFVICTFPVIFYVDTSYFCPVFFFFFFFRGPSALSLVGADLRFRLAPRRAVASRLVGSRDVHTKAPGIGRNS